MRKTKLRRVSKKRQEELAIYAKKRAEALPDKWCEVEDCNHAATEVHHMKSRRGKMLYNVKYWLLTCRACHRRIHDNPKWARENGYLNT